MFDKIGPDTGYDAINNYGPASEMADFFNALHAENALPKTITYSLNGTKIETVSLVAETSVNKLSLLSITKSVLNNWFTLLR